MPQVQFSILGDNPPTASGDRLGFQTFVQPFAQRLIHSIGNTPFTVGIFADWGQGKTTVMRMLQEFLEGQGCPTVWFDPWKYNSREAVWKGLALTLVNEVRKNQTLLREIRRKRSSLSRLAAVGLTSRLVGADWAEKIVQAIETEPWSPALLHEFESNLEGLFNVIDPDQGPINKPFVLFVDDLDRCLPEPALAVLEALKLVLNRAGLITVLGIAEHELTRAVSAAYAKELEALGKEYDAQWGCKYIQKIVQMPFPLPIVSERSFNEYVRQCLLQSQVAPALGREEDWCGIIRDACEGNLREVKRFINHFISESDKASANAVATGAPTSFDPRRVAFVLLLAWRFRGFLEHIRQRANDPELLVRYQLYFSQQSPAGEESLRDPGQTYHQDPVLANLFNQCFNPLRPGEPPLVPPFAGWGDLEPYLQFGSRTEPSPTSAGSTPSTPPVSEPQPREPLREAPETPSKGAPLEPGPEVSRLLSEARALISSGHLDRAAALLRKAVDTGRRSKDLYGLELALGQLGTVQDSMGEGRVASDTLRESLEIARRLGDDQGQLNCLIALSRVLRKLGDPEDLPFLRYALELTERLGDQLAQVTVLLEMGASLERHEDSDSALQAYRKALDTAQQLGHRAGELAALTSMGDLLADRGDNQEAALSLYSHALELAESLGDRTARVRVLQKIGAVHEALGEGREALVFYEKALYSAGDVDAREEVLIQLRIVRVLRQLGKPDRSLLKAAGEKARGLVDPTLQIAVLLEEADTERAEEEWSLALERYSEALAIARSLQDWRSILAILRAMAETHRRASRLSEAFELYEEAFTIARKVEDSRAMKDIEWTLYDLKRERDLLANMKK